ncbi:hypothetical protein [Mycobacterium sp. OTB74]|jgi:hypothetical protein|uniref:hypothetical protein n=1 Tax=Mycobacterium sp. OTB74 TaxID=1853452 RepID=UPI002476F5EB|nr:hypothetical protein [Mycobacterium sp. OTB74]MDH6247102.1 hypothetical protein [Mycobacterium sp. OTB74]
MGSNRHYRSEPELSEVSNIPLLPEETILFSADFTPSPIIRSRKNGLLITDKRVAIIHPQHVLVFVRVGHTVSSTMHDKFAQVTVGRLMSRHHIWLALVFGGLGLYSFMVGGAMLDGYGGGMGFLAMLAMVVFFGLAALQLWLARQLGLTVVNTGGHHMTVAVDSAEHQHMLVAAEMIQQLALGKRVAPYTPPPPPPIQTGYGSPIGTLGAHPRGWGQPPGGGTGY